MSQNLDFKDYEKLARWITTRLMRRARASGVELDAQDLFQEVCLIWCGCRDRFQPEKGKFSLFFVRTAFKAFGHQRLAEKINGRQFQATLSINERVQGEEESVEFGDLLEDETMMNPEDRFLQRERVNGELRKNPLLKRLVELSVEAPPELQAQLDAMRAQRAYARQIGVKMREMAPTALTPELVRRAMRFNWRQRLAAQPEFSEA